MKKATLFALAFMLVGAGLYFYGGPAYRHYKEKRLLTQAKHFAAIGDFRNALLTRICAHKPMINGTPM